MGATNNFGKSEGWLSLRKKMQRKVEEFGRPNPLTAVLGLVTQKTGMGGATVGCAMWQICKEHIGNRSLSYYSLGMCGIACMVFLALSALMSGLVIMFLGFEGQEKKKKKKKHDEGLSPKAKTMIASIFAFLLSSGSVSAFTCMSGNALKDFQNTAYYPYAGAHVGPFIGGFGSFLLWMVMMMCIYKVNKKPKSDEDPYGPPPVGDYGQGPGYGGGYGNGPQGYGPPGYGPAGYGPPGH